MIVQINENNSDKYIKLFTEAYEFLESLNDSPVIPGKGRFSNLAEYYGHMADLFKEQEYKYIMVPLDEDPFLIDLNTRTIAVPANFYKCASVQTDMLAETIIFVADRYFDYMDLANTEIYVQWTAPDGFKGATPISMRDIDSEPGKIKFAWPLNNLITKTPGVVKFAVRFFNFSNGENGKELTYSLNTLTSEITIKPALQPDGPSQIEDNILDLFSKAVMNSNYSATGVNPPNPPQYIYPGTDIATQVEVVDEDGNKSYVISAITSETDTVGYMKLTGMTEEKFAAGSYWIKDNEEYKKAEVFDENETYFIQIKKGIKYVGLNEDNTITLYAQAIATDAGEISYKWYYQAQDGQYNDKPYDCEQIGFGEVNHETFINVGKNPPDVSNERYYVKQGENGWGDYVGNLPAEVDLYERYTTLTIPADSEETPIQVTGLYHVSAWNTVDASGYSKVDNLTEAKFEIGTYYIKEGKDYTIAVDFDPTQTYFVKVDKHLTTNYPINSSTCLLPGPRPIIISKDLTSQIIFDETEKVTLAVEIQDDDYNPEISYDWRVSTSSSEAVFTDSDTITSDNINTINIPGYVKAVVNNKEEFDADIYYILDENNKYVRATEYDMTVDYYKDNAGWYGVNISSKLNRKNEILPSKIVKITHNPVPPRVMYIDDNDLLIDRLTTSKTSVDFTVNIDSDYLDINNKLRSNSIEYIWQMSLGVNQPWITLTEKEPGIELKDNTLTVTTAFVQPQANFRCLVVNELNGKKVIFDHSSDSDGINDKMGIFENKPPYIFEDNKSFAFLLWNTTK